MGGFYIRSKVGASMPVSDFDGVIWTPVTGISSADPFPPTPSELEYAARKDEWERAGIVIAERWEECDQGCCSFTRYNVSVDGCPVDDEWVELSEALDMVRLEFTCDL